MALSITMLCYYAKYHYTECRILFTIMLNVLLLSVVRLNVVMLSVVALYFCELEFPSLSVNSTLA
jgi:hypothetical protein